MVSRFIIYKCFFRKNL